MASAPVTTKRPTAATIFWVRRICSKLLGPVDQSSISIS